MRAKVCYTLYRNCTTNASLSLPIAALFRDDLALRAAIGAARSRIDRMIAAASRASCARPYGTPWTRLLRPLATATPCTACPLLPKHTLRATMKIPLLRPRLNQNSTRNVSSCRRKHEALAGGSFPFEAVIARNTIPSIEAGLRSLIFHDARLVCDRSFFTTRGWSAIAHFTRRKPVVVRTTAESEVAAPTAPLSSQVYQLARFFTAHRLDAPHHSLGYMAMRVTELRGDGSGQLASTRRRVVLRGLRNRLARRARREPTNLPGDDGLRARPSARCNVRTPPRLAPQTPASSRPGGFKRRSRIVSREEFHARARNRSGTNPAGIVAEHSFKELP